MHLSHGKAYVHPSTLSFPPYTPPSQVPTCLAKARNVMAKRVRGNPLFDTLWIAAHLLDARDDGSRTNKDRG